MSSEIKVTNIKHSSSGSNNLVLASDGSATIANGTLTAGTLGSSVTGNWGWKLLETATASGSDTNLSIGSASTITSTYSTYKVLMENLAIPQSETLRGLISISGSAKETSYDYIVDGYDSNDNRRSSQNNSANYWVVTPQGYNDTTDSTGICAEFTFSVPHLTKWHTVRWDVNYHNNGNLTQYAMGTASFQRHTDSGTKGPMTGLKFVSSSGNISRGTLRLYGVINA